MYVFLILRLKKALLAPTLRQHLHKMVEDLLREKLSSHFERCGVGIPGLLDQNFAPDKDQYRAAHLHQRFEKLEKNKDFFDFKDSNTASRYFLLSSMSISLASFVIQEAPTRPEEPFK